MKKKPLVFSALVLCFFLAALWLRSHMPEHVCEEMLVMGTLGRISIISPKGSDVNETNELIARSFRIIKDYEAICNYYAPDSELTSLNKNAYLTEVKVSDVLFEVIEKAMEFSVATNGVFDVTATSLHEPGGYDNIVLDKSKKTVYVKNKKAMIDLGGIATGVAIDKVAEFLDSNQTADYLIDIGGDIYAKGKNQHNESWKVGIRDPRSEDAVLKSIAVDGVAVTTSGNYVKQHIIDPESGKLADSGLKSVTVIADSCVEADVLATAFFAMGKEKVKDFIRDYKKYIEVVFVDDSGLDQIVGQYLNEK